MAAKRQAKPKAPKPSASPKWPTMPAAKPAPTGSTYPAGWFPRRDQVVREPENNSYGRFRVLRRIDGKFVVHDPKQWPPNGQVFGSDQEEAARAEAQRLALGGTA